MLWSLGFVLLGSFASLLSVFLWQSLGSGNPTGRRSRRRRLSLPRRLVPLVVARLVVVMSPSFRRALRAFESVPWLVILEVVGWLLAVFLLGLGLVWLAGRALSGLAALPWLLRLGRWWLGF